MGFVTHIGQYWSARHSEVRLLACAGLELDGEGGPTGTAYDVSDATSLLAGGLALPQRRRSFRAAMQDTAALATWDAVAWTYAALPLPVVELVESLESIGARVGDWAGRFDPASAEGAIAVDLAALSTTPAVGVDHLVAPVIPRRAQAFGVTYLNSALERQVEGRRGDYAFVYQSVKERDERPELFLKATAPEHFVGPGGRMGLRSDLTNSSDMEGNACERVTVSCGIEPELAACVHSDGEIFGYTLADDVSANRIENETLLYLYQAKHFTASLVLGPLIWLSTEQVNPSIDISTRILGPAGGAGREVLFERSTNSQRINSPIGALIGWAASHLRLTPAEVFSTGTDCVPDGRVKVLDETMVVEISSRETGCLRHGAGSIPTSGDLNPDYSRLEFVAGVGDGR